MRTRAFIVALALLRLLAASPGRAAIRVEVDEIVFTLKAGDAKEVFLVGDFNQWNPTVEPMAREGDEFVVRLFLVAGTYRYKFVVDGKAMADPDNPGTSPEQGSPMVLVERSGGLILNTEIPDETHVTRTAGYDARYIGFLFDEEGDTDVEQRVDLGVRATLDRLRARAVVASGDSSWTGSPENVDVFFDRGFVEVEAGKFAVRGFENDSTWASVDPMGLVGHAGVYGYDAGFDYHGVTGMAEGKHASLSARWADETTRGDVTQASVDSADMSAFAAGSGTDTTAYAYAYTFSGSDVLALEATLNTGAFAAGIGLRADSGVNPGVWVDVTRRPLDFATQTYATREDRRASTTWLGWSGLKQTNVVFGYGWSSIESRAYATASGTSDLSTPLDASSAITPVDATRDVLGSDRYVVAVTSNRRVAASLRWDLTRFDFDGIEGSSRADVHRVLVDAGTTWRGWRLSARAAYTDQDYGETPDALYIDWPERNVWLSRWDALDVPSMVGIALDTYTAWSVDAARDGGRVDVGGTALVQTLDVADTPVHASIRAYGDVTVRGAWYLYGDARWAWYDREAWGVDDSFVDLYAEAGYRKGAISVGVGFGLDPWAFDPVVSDFADIGRSEYLRTAIAGGVRRSDATAIGQALVERERSLEDLRVFKLECIIELR